MRLRVDQSCGLLVGDEGWSFSLDCVAGVATLELDGLSLRVRPLRWSEKNRLARFAHMGEAFVRRQLVGACLLDAGAVALDGRQQEVVARLVLWLGEQHGGGDGEGLPLDGLALAGVTLGLCRATGLKPSDLDGCEAAEVEMLWLAARAAMPSAASHGPVSPHAPPEAAAPSRAQAAARAAHEASLPREVSPPHNDDFTRIVIAPDAAAPPPAFDASEDEPATPTGDESGSFAGDDELSLSERAARSESSGAHAAERARPDTTRSLASSARVNASTQSTSRAPTAPASPVTSAVRATGRGGRRRGVSGPTSPASGKSLAQHFRVLAEGTAFRELDEAPPLEPREESPSQPALAKSEPFAEFDATTRAASSHAAAHHSSTAQATFNAAATEARSALTSEAQGAFAAEASNAPASTPRRASPSSEASSAAQASRSLGEAPRSYAHVDGRGRAVPAAHEGRAPSRHDADAFPASTAYEGQALSPSAADSFVSWDSRTLSSIAVRERLDVASLARGAREDGGLNLVPNAARAVSTAARADSREELFEELCERLEESADELGID